jgi:outer membrane lipoprotein SlyB
MNAKVLIMIGMVAGSAIGGFIPTLWGAEAFSIASIVGSAVGGLVGIYAGYKLSRV